MEIPQSPTPSVMVETESNKSPFFERVKKNFGEMPTGLKILFTLNVLGLFRMVLNIGNLLILPMLISKFRVEDVFFGFVGLIIAFIWLAIYMSRSYYQMKIVAIGSFLLSAGYGARIMITDISTPSMFQGLSFIIILPMIIVPGLIMLYLLKQKKYFNKP